MQYEMLKHFDMYFVLQYFFHQYMGLFTDEEVCIYFFYAIKLLMNIKYFAAALSISVIYCQLSFIETHRDLILWTL